jgi:MHS family proline/betaine transporter-like MFS transporter
LSSGHLALIVTAQVLITVFVSAYMGPFFAIVATLFPVSGRYTGLSISYNLASALFGGTAPLMAAVLMERSGSILAPGWYVALCAVCSLIALSTIRQEVGEHTPAPSRGH